MLEKFKKLNGYIPLSAHMKINTDVYTSVKSQGRIKINDHSFKKSLLFTISHIRHNVKFTCSKHLGQKHRQSVKIFSAAVQ